MNPESIDISGRMGGPGTHPKLSLDKLLWRGRAQSGEIFDVIGPVTRELLSAFAGNFPKEILIAQDDHGQKILVVGDERGVNLERVVYLFPKSRVVEQVHTHPDKQGLIFDFPSWTDIKSSIGFPARNWIVTSKSALRYGAPPQMSELSWFSVINQFFREQHATLGIRKSSLELSPVASLVLRDPLPQYHFEELPLAQQHRVVQAFYRSHPEFFELVTDSGFNAAFADKAG